MYEEAMKCDLDNIIHSAKLKRLGELHSMRAQNLVSKAKGEVTKARREAKTSNIRGIKHMSKAIGDPEPSHSHASVETETQKMEARRAR